ncbi:MAG: triose-phosphate isomerase [Gammaproteobacteria bacterium]|nr:MAG: triose-phosphate isomerase [Gammaproteobacteria bacterium]
MYKRKPIAAANWKMNGRLSDVTRFAQLLGNIETKGETIFAPPAVYLDVARKNNTGFALAAQTGNENADGAFTGEVSMPMLADIGCQYVIVGHSERRAIYAESDAAIFAKVKSAFAAGLTPILCIGETDSENQAGKTEAVLTEQLALVIDKLSAEEKRSLVIAYEPVWAIGTGRTPSLDDIQAIHRKIRYLFSQNNDTIASAVRILYGGSVKPDNAAAIFGLTDVDGGLVGGASLPIDSFEKIIKAL